MSDLLTIGSTAVAAYQRALGTVSNNIANVGTEGYVRQETSLSENMPRQQGRVYLGTGVNVAGIKRAYDAFLEQNLRNTTSELNTQGPMVDYANRVVDIMGSDTIGLPPALDKFFASARALSADPASSILRAQLLRDADGLAGRFRELSTQISSVDNETREAINTRLADINTLTEQIATVNKQLAAKPSVDRQPPDLLDQRDLLLTRLSTLVKINVTTANNGSVMIAVGNVANTGVLVNGDESVPMAARFDEKDLSRVAILADPYSKTPQEVIGISSGELGGLLGFREQVLQPTMASLDYLATAVAGEINTIHRSGIDVQGEVGQDLFAIDPVMRTDPDTGESVAIDRAAAGIRVALSDPTRVAAAAQFRVIENDLNLSGVNATLSYAPSYADPLRIRPLSQVLKNNPDPSAGIVPPTNKLLGQLPLGSSNWSLSLNRASSTQQIAVFTRDGRQLTGKSLSEDEQRSLLTTAYGFVAGSTYSDTYLNKSGEYGYKQMGLFYGLKAAPIVNYANEARFSGDVHGIVPTALEQQVTVGTAIPAGMPSIAANLLTINGRVLPALLPTPPATTIQASDMANWINRTMADVAPPVSASAMTTVTVSGDEIDLSKDLVLNGVTIAAPGDDPDWALDPDYTGTPTAAQKAERLRAAIAQTNQTDDTMTVARVEDGALIIENSEYFAGEDILIGSVAGGNALGLAAQRVNGVLTLESDADITVGYGPQGELGDLDKLGRPVGTYFTAVLPREPRLATLRGFPIPNDASAIASGTLELNGKLLPGLSLPAGQTAFKASDYVSWINGVGSKLVPPVTASAYNEVRASAERLSLAGTGGLVINGVNIAGAPFDNAEALVTAINAAAGSNAALERLVARVDVDGAIVLSNDTGEDIRIASSVAGSGNLLGVPNGISKGSLQLTSEAEIRLGFASGSATPAELAKLGFGTEVYIDGPVGEDLLVFITGEGSGTVSGSYDETMQAPEALDAARVDALRAQSFEVSFTSAQRYQITWKNPADGAITVLAERDYDPLAGIVYQGIRLSLDNPPAEGDRFRIDGNQDGAGDNQNMLALVDLERRGVIGGRNGKTLSQAYEEEVGKIGNFASQAKIAQKALEVVNKQAIDARDKVSGVSLDAEAADLIRFQQAYQAAAKAMQTSGVLFDAILSAAR